MDDSDTTETEATHGGKGNGDVEHQEPTHQADREAQPVDDEQPPRLPFAVVGVGASAGGLEAFGEFLKAMPSDSGMAFVFILHLSPDRHSLVADIFARQTKMHVTEVDDGMEVVPDHVYVIRPAHVLTIKNGHLHLGPRLDGPRAANRPVDDFFKSLAQEQRERAIGIILSGMGSNGSAGAQAIKAVGGLCIAQDPESAQFPSMPRHLIEAGYADFISQAAEMPDVLLQYTNHPYASGQRELDAEAVLQREQQHVREIMAVLRTRTKQDFSGYKKPTVLRRIQRRMGLSRITRLSEYAKLLRQSPTEVSALADDLLIHVTGFFRDPEAWETLRERVIVPLVAGRENDASIRCWVTACSSGEEAYSLAIMLVEETERLGKHLDIKVFATDMADRTLANARGGIYPGGIEMDVSPERLGRFFEKDDATYRVRAHLRECVVFAPQNLLQDPPFSRLDIASCRNLLIYLEPEVQQRVLSLLHFGLREGGTLFLGNSETVGSSDQLFEPLDKKARIFRRIGPTRHGMVDFPVPHAFRPARTYNPTDSTTLVDRRPGFRPTLAQITQRALLEHHLPAAVLIDRDHRILYYQGNTRPFFDQPSGEPTRDVMALAREGVRGAIRIALHRAAASNSSAVSHDGWIEIDPGQRGRLTVIASPVTDKTFGEYYVISFEVQEAPPEVEAGSETQAADPGVADDMQRMRDELQSTVEELQTSNEELKASHEEVVSINEELQSSNEELETSKEEMQSLNEELTTVNAQLRSKMEELQTTSNDLASLLTSTDIAVLFLDTRFRIRRFTPPTRELLDLINSDIDRPLSDMARKFDDPALLPDCEMVLARLAPVEREITTAGGRWFLRRITPYRTTDNRIDGVVITFVDISQRRQAEEALRASEEQFRRAIEDAPIPVIMQTEDGQVLQISRTWTELTGYTLADLPTATSWLSRAYGPGAGAVSAHMHELFTGDRKSLDVEFSIHTRDRDDRHWSFSASAPGRLLDGRRFMVGMAVDITDRQRAEESLRVSEEQYRTLFESMDEAYAVVEMMRDGDSGPWNDFRFVELNPAFVRHTGLDNPVGKTATQVLVNPNPRWVEVYGQVAETGEAIRLEESEPSLGHVYDLNIFRLGGPGSRRVAVLFNNITDRKRREEAQAYLLKLSDALRPHANPAAVETEAARVLGETLGVARVFYCEVEPDQDHVEIRNDYLAAGVASMAGRVSITSFGKYWADGYRAGRTLVTSDVRNIPGADTASFKAAGVGACVGVPIHKERLLTGILIVHSATPRVWTPLEVSMVEETAERTWAAVERAKAESTVHDSQEWLRLALLAARMGTWSWDVAGNRHTRDENLNRLLGLEPVKTTQPIEEFFKYIHPDDKPIVRAAFDASVKHGKPLKTEFRVVLPDGSIRWLRDQGEVFARQDSAYMAGACIDVTERHQAEVALRDSEERLRLVVEGARDFAMLLLDETGRITGWNSGAERLLGFTESEAVGQNTDIIFTPEDRAVGASLQERAQAAATGRAEDKRWHMRKSGERFWGSGVLNALRDPDGSVRGFVKVLRDETARKHAEEAEFAARTAAELANRTKDEFLATLSHELRTPLSAILLWAKMLNSKTDIKSLEEGLAAISHSAEAQKQLIEDLLDTSRITSGNLRLDIKSTEMTPVIKEAIESVLPAAQGKGVKLITDISKKIGIVRVDPNRIKQVLWNLLTNAVKFTPAGGTIKVQLSRPDHHVQLSVTDTGKGISSDFLPHVFEPFRQADSTTTRSHGGLGLGLAICQKLVEQHGGTITAESEGPGKGATFTVILPAPPQRKNNAVAPALVDPQEIDFKDVRLLLVEDEPGMRNAVNIMLRQLGAEVIAVDSAEKAFKSFQTSPPDLIISDIGMPDEDGYSLIRRIRDHERQTGEHHIPALALTAFAAEEDRGTALAAGFNDHLRKPVEPGQLLSVIAALLE